MIWKAGATFIFCLMLNGLAQAIPTNTLMGLPTIAVVETVKLKPRMREMPSVSLAGVVSLASIRPFMKPSLIFDNKAQYRTAPYVIAEDHMQLMGGPGSLLYVRGIVNPEEQLYTIYREGKSLCHPITRESLGFEAVAIGTAELLSFNETSKFKVITANEIIEQGAKFLPSYATAIPDSLKLRPARATQEGYILSVRDGVDLIGKNQVVVISLGLREGVQEGDILDIYQANPGVVVPKPDGLLKCKIPIPDTRVGHLLVFQAFEKLSIALILEATGPIYLLNQVRNPL